MKYHLLLPVLPALFLASLTAQTPNEVILGDAPVAPSFVPSTLPPRVPITPPNWIDTIVRATVQDLYLTTFVPLTATPIGWTGNLSIGDAGTTTQAYKDAVIGLVNFYRAMAGVPTGVTLNAVYSAKDQKAAMMMSSNKALSHTPPTNWINYTAEGAEAAGNSNICLSSGQLDVGCVSTYINDPGANNYEVGHRRWLLYPQTRVMGTGDVGRVGTQYSANAIWVFDGLYGTTRPATRETFVAWPPKGYVPYQLLFPRWSFSYPGAIFTNTTIAMTRNGASVPLTKEIVETGYGENTVVWVVDSSALSKPLSDTPIQVTLSNVMIGNTPQTFSYTVTSFDPSTTPSAGPVNVTINSTPTGIPITVDGAQQATPQTFQWTPGSQHTLSAITVSSGSSRQIFSSWSNGGTATQTVTALSANASYTATWTTQYQLSLSVSPAGAGTLTASPSSSDGFYDAGSNVQLTAANAPGFAFTGFSGDLSGPANPTSLILNAARSVVANYSGTVTTVSPLFFTPVPPCRVADTRLSSFPATLGSPSIGAGQVRSFSMTQGNCSIPTTAKAYSVNITVVPAGPLGYLTVWPTGSQQPFVSTLNSGNGGIVSNAAIVPAGSNGQISAFSTDKTDIIIDVNGYFSDAIGLAFFATDPCRIADTRGPTGMFGGPALAPSASRDFLLQNGGCIIPPGAQAYSTNVTVVPAEPLAYLTISRTGFATPLVSTLNSSDARIVAAAAITPAGTNGGVALYSTNRTQAIIDTNGYFAPQGAAGALSYFTVQPCRVADTRNANGPYGGPIMAGGGTRAFLVTQAPCGIPASAKAYAVNITVLPNGPLAYLSTWPTGKAQPLVSTLNSDGRFVSNFAIVPAGLADGGINVFVTNPTHVIIDVMGYFAP